MFGTFFAPPGNSWVFDMSTASFHAYIYSLSEVFDKLVDQSRWQVVPGHLQRLFQLVME